MISADAVVIGAGVIGSSIALELSRDGHQVVVIDKAGGIGHGSTSASSALIRFNYSTWSGVATAWESLQCWQDWAAHLDAPHDAQLARFHRTGMLIINGGQFGAQPTTPMFDQAAIPWEHWDADDISQHLPHLDTGAFWPPKPVDSEAFFDEPNGRIQGIFLPDAGHVDDPQLAAQNLADAAGRHGARYLLNRQVVAITQDADGNWLISNDDGQTVSSRIVVNAAGPWSGALNALAGIGDDFTIGTRPLRQEVHHVPGPHDATAAAGDIALADLDLGIYLRSTGDGNILIGGTEPECDPLEWIDDPDTSNANPTVSRFEAQVMRAARRLPGLHVPNRPRGLAGVYDAADDWTPIYDRTAAPGYYVAMGTSGNQFKNAPVVGQLMAALIGAVEKGHDHDSDPVVFTGPRTGHQIDLGVYSRRRPVSPDSPASVMG